MGSEGGAIRDEKESMWRSEREEAEEEKNPRKKEKRRRKTPPARKVRFTFMANFLTTSSCP